MKIKEIVLTKQLKVGLPAYSNLTVGLSVTAQATKGEKIDFDEVLDYVNQHLGMAVDFDPKWIRSEEFKEHYRFTIRIPKSTTS